MCRFLASARIKIYWMSPEYGSKAQDLPPETQFVLLELSPKGPYAVLLPLIDSGKFRATLRPPRCPHPPVLSAVVTCLSWQQLSHISDLHTQRARHDGESRAELAGLVSWVQMTCRNGDRASEVRLRIESGDESVRASKWDNALLCAAGHNPYELIDSAVAAAAKISGKFLAVPAA